MDVETITKLLKIRNVIVYALGVLHDRDDVKATMHDLYYIEDMIDVWLTELGLPELGLSLREVKK